MGLGSLINVFNPQVIVLDGSLTKIGDLYLGPALETAQAESFELSWRDVRIVVGATGRPVGGAGSGRGGHRQPERRAKVMLIGVISDTHGYFDPRLPDVFRGVERILHAGDIGSLEVVERLEAIAPVVAVHGNMDRAGRGVPLPSRCDD